LLSVSPTSSMASRFLATAALCAVSLAATSPCTAFFQSGWATGAGRPLAHERGVSSNGAISANARALFSTPSHPAYVSESPQRYTLNTMDSFLSLPTGSRLCVSNSTLECGNGNARINCNMFMCAFVACGGAADTACSETRQATRHNRRIGSSRYALFIVGISARPTSNCCASKPVRQLVRFSRDRRTLRETVAEYFAGAVEEFTGVGNDSARPDARCVGGVRRPAD